MSHESGHLSKLHQIVADNIKGEKALCPQPFAPAAQDPDLGAKISDKVAWFGGGWRFVSLFSVILAL